MEENSVIYETHDYVLAAALFAAGCKMAGIKREPPSERFSHGRAKFQFEDASAAEAQVEKYYCGQLLVEAKKHHSTLGEFRQLIYSKEKLGTPKN